MFELLEIIVSRSGWSSKDIGPSSSICALFTGSLFKPCRKSHSIHTHSKGLSCTLDGPTSSPGPSDREQRAATGSVSGSKIYTCTHSQSSANSKSSATNRVTCTELLDELPEGYVWRYCSAREFCIGHWTASLSCREVKFNPCSFVGMAVLAQNGKSHDLVAQWA